MSATGIDRLVQGWAQLYTEAELRARLESCAKSRRPLRVKLGMDPTAPDIHLGHVVVLTRLREFQDLGHKAVLIIGDFTARIGDPTGRSKTRPVLTAEEIERNAETYLAQAGKVLDLSPEKFEIRRNSEWLGRMDFADVLRLAGRMTVGQMLKREDFQKRFRDEAPIGVHEFLYPLMQGHDSVMIEADVELGGTDQTYNNLVGRDLLEAAGRPPQVVGVMPLLRGLDGQKKMSKSVGNVIAVTDSARDMVGKTMSIPDDLMPEWFRLLTSVGEDQWSPLIATQPRQAKELLGRTIAARFHGQSAADEAAAWWTARFGGGRSPEAIEVQIPGAELQDGKAAPWKLAWLAHGREISRSEARRMVENGAFELQGRKITDPNTPVSVADGMEFKAGRHRSGERVKQPLVVIARLNS